MTSAVSGSSQYSQEKSAVESESTRKQIRGSSLLLAGRGISLVINLMTQIAVIRYLSKLDYGAFAWAFSAVELAAMGATFGMDKSLSRFGAIFHEKKDYRRLTGALILTSVVVLFLGGATLLFAWSMQGYMISRWTIDPLAITTLMTLVLLVPINAISSLSLSIFAFLNKVQTVFYRRHLIGPISRLICVISVMALHGGLHHISIAYLVSGLIAVSFDLGLVSVYLKKENIPEKLNKDRPIIPIKELFGYSLPILASDLAFLFRGTFVVLLLGWLASTTASGSFRAVLSIARLNELVLLNFSLLFTPLASRLFSNSNEKQLAEMYEKTSIWALVLSFPMFAASVTLGGPIVHILFGPDYADASQLLAVLAIGYYFQAMMGFNGRLLRVLGRVRLILLFDIMATVLTFLLCWYLIPVYEGIGAVIAVTAGMTFHTLAKYFTIKLTTSYANNATDYNQSFLVAGSCALLLLALRLLFDLHWIAGLFLTGLTSWIVVRSNRSGMNITHYFPEIKRIPVLGDWLTDPEYSTIAEHQNNKNVSSKKDFNIAYMMSRFPKITETFVLSEMKEIEEQGYHVNVYPLQKEKTKIMHADAKQYVDRAFYTPWFSFRFVSAHIHYLLNSPGTYFFVAWTLLKANWGSRRFLGGAIAFFPKNVYIAYQMQKDGINHLHAHFASHPAMAAWVIHQLTHIPYSFTAHGSDLHRDQHMLMEKVKSASSVISISEYNKNMILETCSPEDADKIQVVHCGIDPDKFRKINEETSFNKGLSKFRIACVGTLHEVKGQKYLIEACRSLKESGIDFSCHLIGDGPDEEILKELVHKYNLEESVIFEGRKTSEEIQLFLQDVDVLVVPSVQTKCGRREGIPVVLMEALSSHVAVIASDLSGIPELVMNGETGLLTEPRNSNSIQNAIQALYQDEKLRHQLAESGYQKVLKEFNLSQNAKSLIDLWTDGRNLK